MNNETTCKKSNMPYMKRTIALFAAVLAASFASADLTGKWTGSMNTSGLTSVSGSTGKVVSKGAPTYTLNLLKGGKYTMSTKNPNGKDTSTEGTWKVSGSELTLMPSAESKKKSPQIQDRKLKIGAGEKSLRLEVKARVMTGPATMEGGKIDPKKAEEIKKATANAKETTLVIEFKRA
jgi:hypothetical protein